MRTRLALIASVLVFAVSCGDKAPVRTVPIQPDPDPVVTAPVDAAPAIPEVALPAGFPDSVAGHQLAWVLDLIETRHGTVGREEIEAHFATSFLTQVPIDQAGAVFKQLGEQLADLEVATVVPNPAGTTLTARLSSKGEKLKILLTVDAAGQISGLLFQPDVEIGPKPTTIEEALKTLPTLATDAQVLIARLDKGACKTLHQVNAKKPLALGSTMKLYVLLGLVDQITAGKLTWDTEIAVRDEWKSLPSGITQDDPAGTKLTIRTLAERMISISDNTATDHLLYTVGRKKVEAALKSAKHSRPALDVPFMSTRELFLLKLTLPAAERDRYVAMNAAKRRTFLDGTLATQRPTLEGVDAWKDARQIDTLEWFANSEDLCRVMATLAGRAKKPAAAAVLDVLAKNPGLPIDAKAWPYIGFKGGSEPGVLNLTWLLRRDDDKWFVVTVGLNSPAGPALEDGKILGFATGLLELVAAEGR